MIQPELLHSNSFTHGPFHEPGSSAHPGRGTKDLPSAEVDGSSHVEPHSQLAQPGKEKGGSHSNSVHSCKVA